MSNGLVDSGVLIHLLSDPSPCLRYLVLTELCGLPMEHPEVAELASLRLQDPLIPRLENKSVSQSHLTQVLKRFACLGFDATNEGVAEAAEKLFSMQNKDGSWPIKSAVETVEKDEDTKGYSMVPLQTAIPLAALAACGYTTDHRAERGYAWLFSQQLEDGSWPTGRASGIYGRVAGYRKLPHSRWGCRSNTTGVLVAMAGHPTYRRSVEARKGLDLLLGREKRETTNIGFEIARALGAEPTSGFFTYYARSDPGLVIELCRRFSISNDDPRVSRLLDFLLAERNPEGLWRYSNKPHVSRWVSFYILRSALGERDANSWIGTEPQTAFQEYNRSDRRW